MDNNNKLISPISGDSITGCDIRETLFESYMALKDLRDTAKELEKKTTQDQLYLTSNPYWENLFKQCQYLTENKTKDIEVLSYFLESSIRVKGFEGLSNGFYLLNEIIKKYTLTLHGVKFSEEKEGIFYSLSQLNGINTEGSLISAINLSPILSDRKDFFVSLWGYQQANSPETTLPLNLVSLLVHSKKIKKEILSYHENNLINSIKNFDELTRTLDDLLCENSPPSSRIKNQLSLCMEAFYQLSKKEEYEIPIKKSRIEKKCSHDHEDRKLLLFKIKEVAENFREIEPHSPVPYLLDKAISWGEMDFPDLLQEIMTNKDSLSYLLKTRGTNE